VRRAGIVAAAVAIALGLKLHYAHASADELRWILAPTTWLVETLSGVRFTYEPGSGYLSREHMFLIEKPCAGVNFLVAAIVMSGFVVAGLGVLKLVLAISLSYVTAIVANAARITGALFIARSHEAHRIEGVLVYFVALLGLSILLCPGTLRRARAYVLPLLSYYAVALVVPWLHGGVPLEHTVVVTVIPIAVLGCVVAAVAVTARTRATRTLSFR
jgi:exosortase K